MANKVPSVKVAVIGWTGLESLLDGSEQTRVGTPFGFSPVMSIGKVEERRVVFLPRHNSDHSLPLYKVNYKANIYSLHKIDVERIMATNAVGAINMGFKPGELVVPRDLIDLTKQRPLSFYERAPVAHVDFSEPYCPEIRKALTEKTRKVSHVHDKAVYACTEDPRFETAAEIQIFRTLGCDIVGITSMPEAVLARELEMCYATLCFVSNMAAGISKRPLSSHEVMETSKLVRPIIHKILIEAICNLPTTRHCPCPSTIEAPAPEK